MNVKNVSIEAEYWEKEEWDYIDDNTRVWVTLENNKTYGADFYTFECIKTLQSNWVKSGEFLRGKYFSLKNVVLVDNCSRKDIEEVVHHLLVEDEFFDVFEFEEE